MGIRARRHVGAFLWLLGVGIALVWAQLQPRAGAIPGLGRDRVIRIAATMDGRIDDVLVELHQRVRAGETVARLSPDRLELERAIAAAEFLALADPPSTNLDQALTQARRDQVRAASAVVRRRITTLERLVEAGAATAEELDRERRRLRQLEQKALRLDTRREGRNPWPAVAALRRLDAVEARLTELELRSSIDGLVVALHHRPGAVVRKGDPLVTIEEEQAREVLAWAPPARVPNPGSTVTVQRADGSLLRGEVVSVAPGTSLIPEQIWTIPGRPQYGVSVRVRLSDAHVRPREPVQIFL